jgi:hypothetical protein
MIKIRKYKNCKFITDKIDSITKLKEDDAIICQSDCVTIIEISFFKYKIHLILTSKGYGRTHKPKLNGQ